MTRESPGLSETLLITKIKEIKWERFYRRFSCTTLRGSMILYYRCVGLIRSRFTTNPSAQTEDETYRTNDKRHHNNSRSRDETSRVMVGVGGAIFVVCQDSFLEIVLLVCVFITFII